MFLPAIFGVGCFFAFLVTFGIGANDLANSFGTAYGAKVLTLNQLVVLAAICEMSGAILMGSEVAKTISAEIAYSEEFTHQPGRFMEGMFSALVATSIWLGLATWRKLPVSTTHSIIGGVIGFVIVQTGFSGIKWGTSKEAFPYFGGVTPIFVSWVTSPLMSLVAAVGVYGVLRSFVLRKGVADSSSSDRRAILFFAGITYFTMFVNTFFVFYKGMKSSLHWSPGKCAWVSALVAIPFSVAAALVVPLIMRRSRAALAQKSDEGGLGGEDEDDEGSATLLRSSQKIDDDASNALAYNSCDESASAAVATGDNLDNREENNRTELGSEENPEAESSKIEVGQDKSNRSSGTSKKVKTKPEVESYDPVLESLFRYLQISTSVVVSFAHGANDVSNGIGALAAIYAVSKTGQMPTADDSEVPLWMLAGGGVGIVAGLATFGRRVLAVVGTEMVTLTPSRGFSAQFATALVLSVCSAAGMPVSTTHCITGAVIGIGLLDDWRHAVEWKIVLKIASGWVLTVVITSLSGALFYLPFYYAAKNPQ